MPYARYGETPESVAAQIAGLPAAFDRDALQRLLPPGAARNAVDCALWDLEAKRAGRRVWELAGLAEPGPEVTAYTLSLDTPEAMRAQAAENARRPLLKVKLGGEGDLARLEAVRAGAPAARIVVDANEGWTAEGYAGARAGAGRARRRDGRAAAAGRRRRGARRHGAAAAGLRRRELPRPGEPAGAARASYDMVNIKLDKTGGLTEALALRAAARGRRASASWSAAWSARASAMAPAVLVAQGAAVVDLDGPLLLARDRDASASLRRQGRASVDAGALGVR